ncbi:MAG: helix-turn-helix domain-containing protein [Bifidobacteriaceae bacterium]|nr:helix-turn-helix domain-containing protein [Bifidobacteriaceae bacterium]
MKLPQKLRELRQAAGLTQAEVAGRLFVKRQTLSKWENGVNSPDLEMIVKLCDLYGASLDAVLRPDAELVAAIAGRQRSYRKLIVAVVALAGLLALLACLVQLRVALG